MMAVKGMLALCEVGTQNMEAEVVLERIPQRMGLVVVLSSVLAVAGLASLQDHQLMAVMVVLGVVIRLVLAALVE